jgi:UDP-glucose 4-epimerase
MTLTAYRGKRVLVTGGAGFIGARLCAALRKAGAKVYALDSAAWTGALRCDLSDEQAVKSAVSRTKPEIVFHLAALTDRDPSPALLERMLETNLQGARNLLEALRERGCRAVVFSGTAEEYGRGQAPYREVQPEGPVSPYSFSKSCATQLALFYHQVYGLPVTVLRPTLAYGPGQPPTMFLPALMETLLAGRPFPMTPGGQTRDFVFVDDLVEAYLSAGLAKTAAGQVINIGSSRPVKIRDMALLAARVTGKTGLLQLGARPYRSSEIMSYSASSAKAKRLLGWCPRTTLAAGLKLTAESYRHAGK